MNKTKQYDELIELKHYLLIIQKNYLIFQVPVRKAIDESIKIINKKISELETKDIDNQ